LPISRLVTARIRTRTRWLNWKVTNLGNIRAACFNFCHHGHYETRSPSCNYKSSTRSKDQEQKDGGFCPKKEWFLAHIHHVFDSKRTMWCRLRVKTGLINWEQLAVVVYKEIHGSNLIETDIWKNLMLMSTQSYNMNNLITFWRENNCQRFSLWEKVQNFLFGFASMADR
jgi:hypothetical protein